MSSATSDGDDSTLTSVRVLNALRMTRGEPADPKSKFRPGPTLCRSADWAVADAAAPIVNTIEMRNTGVILKVLPHIHANGSIQLEIDQEISNVVNADQSQQQTLTPTISQRRVHSSVSVISGQTVLLAGLISESSQQTRSGIPGLSEIKFLGDVFGNTSKTKSRSEIIIFIKTQLIRNGHDAGAVTEEFREKLQTMRGGRAVISGTEAAAGPAVLPRK